jgi:enamine deaminase RidA (YjgF/YER057c/UK114 family)
MTFAKRYSWPDNHWNWPVDLSHQHGVRAGEFVFTGGQADLDSDGNVQHPHDVEAQVASVTEYLLAVLSDLDAKPADLVRLVIYFVGSAETEAFILEKINSLIGDAARPVVNTVPVPSLCYPGMVIELEGVAVCGGSEQNCSRRHIRLDNLPALAVGFSHIVVCGDMVFIGDMSAIDADGSIVAPNDVIGQSTIMMDQLGVALKAAGSTYDDVLKLNVFYTGDGTAANWEQPALIRQAYFSDPGPAATGISLPAFEQPGLMTKIAATAVVSSAAPEPSDAVPRRIYSWPQGHWDWTTSLPYKHGNRYGQLIHLGGQVSLDKHARVLDAGDIVAQTKRALSYIESVLADLGATMNDVVKVTTFYEGTASASELHENLVVRSAAFDKPGPATTGIPVPSLVYENMRIEIEVIAVVAA